MFNNKKGQRTDIYFFFDLYTYENSELIMSKFEMSLFGAVFLDYEHDVREKCGLYKNESRRRRRMNVKIRNIFL